MRLTLEMWEAVLELFFDQGEQTPYLYLIERNQEFKIVAPQQETSRNITREWRQGGQISCDLLTGEIYQQYPPEGYCHAGGIFSHDTMLPFFSGTTDKSELLRPGVYLCVGNLKSETKDYTVVASQVKGGHRQEIPAQDIVDMDFRLPKKKYHPKVQELIETLDHSQLLLDSITQEFKSACQAVKQVSRTWDRSEILIEVGVEINNPSEYQEMDKMLDILLPVEYDLRKKYEFSNLNFSYYPC